jgi:hypothetical protein
VCALKRQICAMNHESILAHNGGILFGLDRLEWLSMQNLDKLSPPVIEIGWARKPIHGQLPPQHAAQAP